MQAADTDALSKDWMSIVNEVQHQLTKTEEVATQSSKFNRLATEFEANRYNPADSGAK
jgi:hypothetical protein